MAQGRKTSSILICAATFILMEVAALAMLHGTSALQNIWINRASHRVMALLWGSGETLRSHFQLERLNEELQAENASLQERLRAYEAQETERDVQARAGMPPKSTYRYIPATVVKMSRNRTRNYIILDKGSEDGVRPQSGIISDRGVVGIVEAVDRHYSYGLTLMNPDMSVGARIGGSDVVAPLSWDGLRTDGAVVRNIPPHYTIEPGDTVRTSGYSTIFPPGIPIGTTGRTRLVDGSTRQVDVTLFQDFATVRYVTVVDNLERAEIMAVEAAGEDRR